jgi:hypothetical protein
LRQLFCRFRPLQAKKTNVFSSVTRLILADAEGIRSSVNCVATGKTPAPAKTGGHLFDERTIPNGKRLRSQRFIRNRATRNLFANLWRICWIFIPEKPDGACDITRPD